MLKKQRSLLLAGFVVPAASEMEHANEVARVSREVKSTYETAMESLTVASVRQKTVIANNHLAPSFAAALGRGRA